MAREHTIADLAKPFVDGPQHDGAAGAYALPRAESLGYVFVDARGPRPLYRTAVVAVGGVLVQSQAERRVDLLHGGDLFMKGNAIRVQCRPMTAR